MKECIRFFAFILFFPFVSVVESIISRIEEKWPLPWLNQSEQLIYKDLLRDEGRKHRRYWVDHPEKWEKKKQELKWAAQKIYRYNNRWE